MKKIITVVIIIAVIIAVGYYVVRNKPQPAPDTVLADGIALTVFTDKGVPTGNVGVKIPYSVTKPDTKFISVAVDVDNNGTLTPNEWVVKNMPLLPNAKLNSTVYFTAQNISGSRKIEVAASTQKLTDSNLQLLPNTVETKIAMASVTTFESGANLVDLSTVTKPDQSMKAGGEQTGPPGQIKNDTPDIAQRKDECAPTSAADSLIRLAGDHGEIDKLPKDPYQMIDDLKSTMKWTVQNGVLTDNFVAGKNEWAAKMGLPIRTSEAGELDGRGTIREIKDALDKGGAAELRLRYTPTGSSKTVGGHLVAVTDIREVDGHTYIDIHDPASPAGTDTYELNGTQLVGYGPADKLDTYISVGFTQIWEGTPTGQPLQPMTNEEIQGIKNAVGEKTTIPVIDVNGHKVPVSQLYVGTGPDCDAPHYHATQGSVTALDKTVIKDPEGCGFGKVASTPVEQYQVP